MQDSAATLALLHRPGAPAAPWYEDWLALSELAPALGTWITLSRYQRDGLGWLHFLRKFGFGGCLADDMGLGKTVQVLALLESRRELRNPRPST